MALTGHTKACNTRLGFTYALYPFTMVVYWSSARSSQPQRRFLLVVTPTSLPRVCKRLPVACKMPHTAGTKILSTHTQMQQTTGHQYHELTSNSSVGKGPSPTLVVYAFTTPITSPMLHGGSPKPVQTPPILQLDEVT